MTNIKRKTLDTRFSKRIQSIEVCRLIASFFIVFIHILFPGNWGDAVDALAKFAVPFFFMISGYFAFDATPKQIKMRALAVAKLNMIATFPYILWETYKVRYILFQSRFVWLKSILTLEEISNWVFLNTHPFAYHLWYLNALFVCYCAIHVYTKIIQNKNFHPLYQAALSTLLVHLILGALHAKTKLNIPLELYRNALFFGFPMFTLGLFFREYQNKILTTFHLTNIVLSAIALLGCALTLLGRFGFGSVELHIGSIVTDIAIILLLMTNPQITKRHGILSKSISKFGNLSTWIYITHPFWADFCENFGVIDLLYCKLSKNTVAYIFPILVVAISIFTGIVWESLRSSLRRITQHFHP